MGSTSNKLSPSFSKYKVHPTRQDSVRNNWLEGTKSRSGRNSPQIDTTIEFENQVRTSIYSDATPDTPTSSRERKYSKSEKKRQKRLKRKIARQEKYYKEKKEKEKAKRKEERRKERRRKRKAAKRKLGDLPQEILGLIYEFLPSEDMYKGRLVNKHFQEAILLTPAGKSMNESVCRFISSHEGWFQYKVMMAKFYNNEYLMAYAAIPWYFMWTFCICVSFILFGILGETIMTFAGWRVIYLLSFGGSLIALCIFFPFITCFGCGLIGFRFLALEIFQRVSLKVVRERYDMLDIDESIDEADFEHMLGERVEIHKALMRRMDAHELEELDTNEQEEENE